MHKGFSIEAHTYDRGRPEYPAEVVPWLVDPRHRQIVDLGAGTGKFTSLLARYCEDVIAVEPADAMRAQLTARLPNVCTVAGCAESLPLDTASVDALFCAQAFHWFATETALIEIHRALRPGGRFGLIWNVRDESVDWVAAITEIITPFERDTPRFHTGDWRKIFPSPLFSSFEKTCLGHQHVGTAQEVIVDRILSVSFIAALPDAEKGKIRAQLQTLATTHPAIRGREKIAFPYTAEAYRCVSLVHRATTATAG